MHLSGKQLSVAGLVLEDICVDVRMLLFTLVRSLMMPLGSYLRTFTWMMTFAPCYSRGVGGCLVTGA